MGGNNKFKRTVFEYMGTSFIAIMPVGRKHVNMNFGLENAINQSMFFRDLTTPTIFRVPFKRFRMPRACHRMLCYFIQKPNSLLKVSRLTAFKLGKSFFSFRSKGYSIHLQSELKSANSEIESTGKELFLCEQRRVSLLLGYKFAQVPRGTPQQIIILGYDAHVAEQFCI